MAGPWNTLFRDQEVNVGARATGGGDSRRAAHPGGEMVRVGHGSGKAGQAKVRRPGAKGGEGEGEKIAALGWCDVMNLIDDHAFEVGEELRGAV